ncbi:conserved hypothetical protein [Agrobacterium deltaense NCPPB 1641]|uniref:Uncharacterized protein n=1 Tax=Agrobacterium deltaense NCPPB 1641 TaxID=1183425 RepID=A0A1S7U538_9HYPH|nr:conserved hypothetical protein [Agrobacterium deltaense NCPPB 1641]
MILRKERALAKCHFRVGDAPGPKNGLSGRHAHQGASGAKGSGPWPISPVVRLFLPFRD